MMAEDEPTFPEVGITLNTHGFLISGILCSRKDYMTEAEAFASGIAGIETGKAVATLHQFVRDSEALEAAKGERPERPGDFIHLPGAENSAPSTPGRLGGFLNRISSRAFFTIARAVSLFLGKSPDHRSRAFCWGALRKFSFFLELGWN